MAKCPTFLLIAEHKPHPLAKLPMEFWTGWDSTAEGYDVDEWEEKHLDALNAALDDGALFHIERTPECHAILGHLPDEYYQKCTADIITESHVLPDDTTTTILAILQARDFDRLHLLPDIIGSGITPPAIPTAMLNTMTENHGCCHGAEPPPP